ncbi:hypothetical protein PF004_g21277 [Phytophthora fragariae]|uniref:Crinkler effector protein N-terminal domain-containing protein n=1 Tax=Phytophthora fragariae TaxID=53985 RepID=A0A6G0N3E5_9STRA|nr:hypothetical protein PF004_g21277 [Phytophthora fragariae]
MCALVGHGIIFPVVFDTAKVVGLLKEAIVEKLPRRFKRNAIDLQLFLAKTTKGTWLPEESVAALGLEKGKVHQDIQTMIDDEQLQTSKTLDFWLFEQNDMPQPTSGQIHVLVVTLEGDSGVEVQNVERDAKRHKVDENVSLEKLWKYSEMKMTALPPLNELCRRFFNGHCRSNWHCGHQSGLATRMARSFCVMIFRC